MASEILYVLVFFRILKMKKCRGIIPGGQDTRRGYLCDHGCDPFLIKCGADVRPEPRAAAAPAPAARGRCLATLRVNPQVQHKPGDRPQLHWGGPTMRIVLTAALPKEMGTSQDGHQDGHRFQHACRTGAQLPSETGLNTVNHVTTAAAQRACCGAARVCAAAQSGAKVRTGTSIFVPRFSSVRKASCGPGYG